MANMRVPMRRIKEVLRLKHHCRFSHREIAANCQMAVSTVSEYLKRAQDAGLSWSEAQNLSERELGSRLFANPVPNHPRESFTLPDYEVVHQELTRYRNLNLTLTQLWIEYKEQNPAGYQYTQFCEHYSRWKGSRDYCMRQVHKAGEKLFVDYGQGLCLTDPKTGEQIKTHLFVAVWGASNFTYAEAALSQELPSWIQSHAHAFDYFGCVPHVLVPDCLKSGVSEACFYEPEINPTYQELAEHYGAAVLPARPKHPRDKAKVECGVLIAKRWILSVLRHRIFYSLSEMNAAIKELLEVLNHRALRKLKISRKELFEKLDRPSALPLPDHPYEYAEWKKATVNIDYHIEVDSHYYSVPFSLIREKLEVRITTLVIEVFLKGDRVTAHQRSYLKHRHTTLAEHMPPDHRKYLEWTPSRIIQWAGQTGPATAKLVENILGGRTFPEQGYRSCLGVLRLGKHYGSERLEAAAIRALQFNVCSFKSVRAILVQGLDRQSSPGLASQAKSLPYHKNVRGENYFH